jgi:hypothetical protein
VGNLHLRFDEGRAGRAMRRLFSYSTLQNSTTHRKEPRRTVPHFNRFHDHLVLESKPHFMIILQLENAGPSKMSKTPS